MLDDKQNSFKNYKKTDYYPFINLLQRYSTLTNLLLIQYTTVWSPLYIELSKPGEISFIKTSAGKYKRVNLVSFIFHNFL